MGVPFLGQIPFDPELGDLADRGLPFVASRLPDSGRISGERKAHRDLSLSHDVGFTLHEGDRPVCPI